MKRIMLIALLVVGSAFAESGLRKSDIDARFEKASQQMMRAAVDLVRSTSANPKAVKFRSVEISPGGKAVCGEYNAPNKAGAYVGFYRFMVTSNNLAYESAKHLFDQQEWVNKCLSDGDPAS